MRWKVLVILGLAVVAVAGGLWWRNRLGGFGQSVTPEQDGAVLSPDHRQGIRMVQESGTTRVWLETYPGGSRRLLAHLQEGQAATNAMWSPDGRLVAFEAFDSEGHSPMTTNHVWIVDASSGEIRRLRLPPPNERFSTYVEGWTSGDTLRVRTTLLDKPEDVFFVYSFRADEIHPAG